ncbi:MAG: sugar ABC transporter ATP-binding protein [Acidimicrobiia bacterium]
MQAIDKRFPGVHALDCVDFDLYEGEVHVLLGENGAGKSTLMKILSGSLPRDGGRIVVQDEEVGQLTPEGAQARGIAMVHQEPSLVPTLSVAENIFLGRPPRSRLGLVDWRRMLEESRRRLDRLGMRIDPQWEVRRLNVAEQQLTEIARVLAAQPRLLVLDEPTSALSDAERARLFGIIRRLQRRGVGIVYISHRLVEVPLIGQRVTVLRDGRLIGTLPVDEAEEETLVRMMVGRRLEKLASRPAIEPGEPVLRVEDLRLAGVLEGISLELHRGEVLGIFGLMGAGQTELARAIFGLEPASAGRVLMEGRALRIRGPADAIRHGLGLLTRDRREALVPMLPIPPNITLAGLSQAPFYRILDLQAEDRAARRYVRDLDIQTPSLDRLAVYLSGGNQQKLILARWLYSDAKVLIFDEPTRGIDVGAKAEVFGLMNELTERGVGIIMISSEMPELLAMADRILVMRAGTLVGEFGRGEATQEQLLRRAS